MPDNDDKVPDYVSARGGGLIDPLQLRNYGLVLREEWLNVKTTATLKSNSNEAK